MQHYFRDLDGVNPQMESIKVRSFAQGTEPDAVKRMAMAEEYFDHVFDVMLQPCVIEMPIHPLYNADAVGLSAPGHAKSPV